MASTDIPHVEIPDHLRPLLGEPDLGTRMYRRYGWDEDFRGWWDAVCEICGKESSVSPGGVSMYVRVSRAGVHKRMREGRITAFLFHKISGVRMFTRKEILENAGLPYIYIPGVECKAWAELLATKDRATQRSEAVGDGDYDGEFLVGKPRKVPKR